jgi:hypothetical protein
LANSDGHIVKYTLRIEWVRSCCAVVR